MQQQKRSEIAQVGAGVHWHRLGDVNTLAPAGRAVFKLEGRQIAVFETPAGLFAINNRCPHEGFPLLEGTLKGDCVLACNWHGWSFDLKSGQTIQGRDPVKTYPIEKRPDGLWVELAPEPVEALKTRAYGELEEAMAEHDYERIARALCRLERAGEAYEAVATWVVNWSLDRFERGIDHTHAGLADWMALAGDDPEYRLTGFLEAFGHFSWDSLFAPKAPVGSKLALYRPQALQDAIEAMDQDRALALVRGAFRDKLGYADLKPVFLSVIFNHYAGFGHPAIYVMKAEELISRLGPAVEETLALQTARYLCLAAREDLIPEFRAFADYLRLAPGTASAPPAVTLAGQPVRRALAMAAASSAAPEALWEQLLAASALNMLRFDLGRQDRVAQPIAQNVGWLDFTHALTFAEAVHRHASAEPAYWQSGLLQMACFIGRNAGHLGEGEQGQWRVEDTAAFLADAKEALFNMDEGEYIFSVHRLKMVRAVGRLVGMVVPETAALLMAALNRYLHTRQRKRHAARAAFQARQSVMREG